MKRTFIIFWLACCWAPVLAQNSAFVLVDVSGNPLVDLYKITLPMRQEAIALARAVITNNFNSSFNNNWKLPGNTDPRIESIVAGQGRPLIDPGGFLMIMPFGERNTYTRYQINPIINYPSDFDRHWQFPFSYDEQQTFGEIAKARAADVALAPNFNLSKYFLIIIAGKGEDTDSQSYTPQEQKYLDNYRSAVSVTSLAVFRYKDARLDFKVEFAEIDVNRMKTGPGGSRAPLISSRNVSQKILEITTPKGSRAAPGEFSEKDNILVRWRCLGCSDSTRFVVQLSKQEGGERVAPITVFKQFSHSVPPLKAGVYDIKVSGDNLTSQRVYIKIAGAGGWGWLVVLLALAALAAVARYVWTNFLRNREEQEEPANRSIFEASRRQTTQNLPPSHQSTGGGPASIDEF